MNKLARGILNYLKDWKNLLAHALIGVGILLVAFFLPVKPLYRVLILVAVVILNVTRMRLEKRKKEDTPVSSEATE